MLAGFADCSYIFLQFRDTFPQYLNKFIYITIGKD